MEYIIEFNEYAELPFSKTIQDELFKMHTHGNLVDSEEIVYTESDVLILLQMLTEELNGQNNITTD